MRGGFWASFLLLGMAGTVNLDSQSPFWESKCVARTQTSKYQHIFRLQGKSFLKSISPKVSFVVEFHQLLFSSGVTGVIIPFFIISQDVICSWNHNTYQIQSFQLILSLITLESVIRFVKHCSRELILTEEKHLVHKNNDGIFKKLITVAQQKLHSCPTKGNISLILTSSE